MVKKDGVPEIETDRGESGKKEFAIPEDQTSQEESQLENKTEIRNAHASGDGSMGRVEERE